MSLTYGLTSVVHIPHVERPKCPHDAYPIIFNFGRALHYGLPTARDVKKDLGFEISDLTLLINALKAQLSRKQRGNIQDKF